MRGHYCKVMNMGMCLTLFVTFCAGGGRCSGSWIRVALAGPTPTQQACTVLHTTFELKLWSCVTYVIGAVQYRGRQGEWCLTRASPLGPTSYPHPSHMSHGGCLLQGEAGVVVPGQAHLSRFNFNKTGMHCTPCASHVSLVLFSAGGGRGSGA